MFINNLLNAFNYQCKDKLNLISQLRDGFGREYKDTKLFRKQLGKRYKILKSFILDDLESINTFVDEDTLSLKYKMLKLLEKWNINSEVCIAKVLQVLNDNHSFEDNKNKLISSLIHMHINRVFSNSGREHELVIHDFLRKFYFYKSNT